MSATRAIIVAFAALAGAPAYGQTMHKCDPATDEGWSVVPTREVLSQKDGAPYQAGEAGNWYVERITTVLPFCNYFNAIGNYSLNSYSLEPVDTEERVAICKATGQGGSIAVAPYGGPCPPK